MVRFNVQRYAHCLMYLPKNGCYVHRILFIVLGSAHHLLANTGEEFNRRNGTIAGGDGATSWRLEKHETIIEMLVGSRPRPTLQSFGVDTRPYNLFTPIEVPTSLELSSRLTRTTLLNMMLAAKIEPDAMCHIPLDIPNRPRLKSPLRQRAQNR